MRAILYKCEPVDLHCNEGLYDEVMGATTDQEHVVYTSKRKGSSIILCKTSDLTLINDENYHKYLEYLI